MFCAKALLIACVALATLGPEAWAKGRCVPVDPKERFDFARLHALVDGCKPHSIADVLRRLPEDYFSTFTLAYDSRSLQAGTPEKPRAIVLGHAGNLTLTFTDAYSSATANQRLEYLQLNATGDFEFEALSFDPRGNPSFTGVNPPSCRSCHGQVQPRPIFDPYFFWPGMYFSEDDEKNPAEEELMAAFLGAGRKRGPYGFLKGAPTQLNLFNDEIGRMNALNLRKEILSHPALAPYRFALLGAMGCSDDLGAYLPEPLKRSWPLDLSKLVEETRALASRSFQQRLERHYHILAIDHATASRVVRTARDHAGTESHPGTTARVRYLIEGLGFPMQGWSTEFGSNVASTDRNYSPNYSFDDRGYTFDRLQRLMWKDLLHADSANPDERALYQTFLQVSTHDGRSDSDLVFFGADQGRVCGALSDLSRATLGGPSAR